MDNGNNPTSSRVSFTSNLAATSSPLRRSRADTMPSQSSAFPYASDLFSSSNLTLNTEAPFSRHRSGSVTLPNEDEASFAHQTPFYYDPSSPIDENASNTIASTLASLGLDDEEKAYDRYTMNPDLNAFSPFSPHTRSSLHRPRAISLGMVDTFSPFDMSAKPTTRFTPLRSSRSSNNLPDLNDMHEEDYVSCFLNA